MTDNASDQTLELWVDLKRRHAKEKARLFLHAIQVTGSKVGASELLGVQRRTIQRTLYPWPDAQKPEDIE